MRLMLTSLGLTLSSLSTATGAQAQPPTPPRAVERIAMPQAVDPLDPAEPLSAATQDAFAVHDLRRRWMESQLRAAATGPDGSWVTAPGGWPLSPVAPVSSIVAPGWMTPAAVFSASMAFAPRCAVRAYAPSGLLPAAAEERRRAYFGLVRDIACEFGIPLGLFDALIIRESGYDPTIYSPKFAYGLTQLMSDTARGLGVDRYDIDGNLRGGARYLRQQLDRFGQYHLALAAYNAGPGRVRSGMVPAIAETRTYVARVLSNWSRLEGVASPTGLIPQRTAMISLFRLQND